jgi:hypothetical protein
LPNPASGGIAWVITRVEVVDWSKTGKNYMVACYSPTSPTQFTPLTLSVWQKRALMQALGHKNIKNTLLYVQLEEALFQGEQDYISKVAKTEKEVCDLVEAGFEYVTDFEGTKIFRKRKL